MSDSTKTANEVLQIIRSLPETEQQKLGKALENAPGLLGNRVVKDSKLLDLWDEIFKKSWILIQVKDEFNLRYKRGPAKKRERTDLRHKAIDDAFEAGLANRDDPIKKQAKDIFDFFTHNSPDLIQIGGKGMIDPNRMMKTYYESKRLVNRSDG
jgi:hypothetical protein